MNPRHESKMIQFMKTPDPIKHGYSRRGAMQLAAGVAAGLGAARWAGEARAQMPQSSVEAGYRIRHGRIRQSIMGWTFKPMPVPD